MRDGLTRGETPVNIPAEEPVLHLGNYGPGRHPFARLEALGEIRSQKFIVLR